MRRLELTESERSVLELTISFFEGRLEDSAAILWAAGLPEWRSAERLALERLVFRASAMKEPYRTAWAAVFESWTRPDEDTIQELHLLQLDSSVVASGREVRVITDAVRPFLTVEDPDRFAAFRQGQTRTEQPGLSDLLHISVSSGDFVSAAIVSLGKVDDTQFLIQLAKSLDSALCEGLALHRRFMNDGGIDLPSYLVRRVYFVEKGDEDWANDPDRYSRGFACVTKLLFASVSRLA